MNGAFGVPSLFVHESLPDGFCQTPSPPWITPSFLVEELPAPSQNRSVSPAVLIRLTCFATDVCKKKSGDGIVPMVRPLFVSAPL